MSFSVEQMAAVAHETNAAYCRTLDDFSQPSWNQAPAWQRQSAIQGVEFHLANSHVTPRMSHENWLAQKRADGWKLGPVKDAEKKEHPCFVPYEELPLEQLVKDHLFRAIVAAFSEAVDERMLRD